MAILDGIKVVDLSAITAGGRTTQILADYGASVIKVEGPQRPDPFRHWTAVTGDRGRGDLGSTSFRVVNRNKRAISLDLKHAEGVEVMRRLVVNTDLIVENFRRGVMARLGLDYATLSSWNPTVVLLSLSSQGPSGPESGYTSFGSTLEALSGMMSTTGYDTTTPTWSTNKVNYPDQTVSLLAPGLALWGVLEARRTGHGTHIDISQRELTTWLLGDQLVESAATGSTPEPRANQSSAQLDWCCRASGSDEWVAISVADDNAWEGLWSLVGGPDDAVTRELAMTDHLIYTELGRRIESWSRARSREDAVAELTAVGVPAAPVRRAAELMDEPDAAVGEDFYVRVPLPDSESGETQISWAANIEPDGDPCIRSRAPHLGEHTVEVLTELGYDAAEIDSLFANEIVSDRVLR